MLAYGFRGQRQPCDQNRPILVNLSLQNTMTEQANLSEVRQRPFDIGVDFSVQFEVWRLAGICFGEIAMLSDGAHFAN